MKPTRRQRTRICLLLIASLLFQQLTLAAVACTPTQMAQMTGDRVAMSEACAEAGMGWAKNAPPLCEKRCAPDRMLAAAQSVLHVPALGLPPVVFVLPVLPPGIIATHAHDVPTARSDQPPRLRYCSLLI